MLIMFVFIPFAFPCRFALCFWIYSTMDNIDGKQARRTNSSSPLGELFDHGCDALNCPVGSIIQIASLGLGYDGRALIAMFISCWGFYLPTWEEYHTGVLYLGFINGPTEGLLAVITTILISAAFGPEIWFKSVAVPAFFGVSSVKVVDFVIAAFMGLFTFYYVPSCVWTVYCECKKKGSSFVVAISQLFPMAVGTGSVALWLSSKYSTVQTDNFILFFTTVGIVFGKMATRIIYAHVSKCPFPMYTGMMIPLVIGSILMISFHFFIPQDVSGWIPLAETTFLWCYFVMCVVGYSNWIYHTIKSICMHCDIYCLKIKERSVETTVSLPSSPTAKSKS